MDHSQPSLPADGSGAARPIRFCMFATFYPPWNFGGDGIHVQRLAHALADRGHEVTVVTSPAVHRLLSGQSPASAPEHPGVEVVRLNDNLASLTARYLAGRPIGAKRRLGSLLERGFDVLHYQNPSLLGAPRLLAMGAGVKLYTAHEQWLLCPSHQLWRRDGRVCENPPCWSCEITHRRPPQLWRRTSMLRRSLTHLDALIAPSRSSAELHRRFADLVRLEVLPSFAPAPAQPPPGSAVAEPSPRRPYFLYVGRLEPIKGVETLIKAFRRERSEELVIAGEGSEAPRLRRSAADLPGVRFTGWLPQEQLDHLYRGALAALMPTRGHEVLPLVALEAFANGTPLIVRGFGTLAELAETTGAAIPYESESELDAALDRIAADQSFRRRLGERARDAYAERFSLQAYLRRYMLLIARIAHERGDAELSCAARAAAPVAAPGEAPPSSRAVG